MAVIDVEKIRKSIKEVAIAADSYKDDFLGIYKFISNSISAEKEKIEQLGCVDLIIVEDLYEDYERSELSNVVIQKKERDITNIFVLGEFETDNKIVWELAEVFANFYVEFLWLPIFTTINYESFAKNPPHFTQKLETGIIVYESESSLYRNSPEVHLQC